MAKTNGSKSRKESGDSSPALARLLQTRQRAYPQGIRKKRGAFVSAFAPGSTTDKESRLLGLRYVVPSKNGVDRVPVSRGLRASHDLRRRRSTGAGHQRRTGVSPVFRGGVRVRDRTLGLSIAPAGRGTPCASQRQARRLSYVGRADFMVRL